MVLTPSVMIPLGSTAPDFELIEAVTGQKFSLQQLKSQVATVVMFICNHCPYVKHIQAKLSEIADLYEIRGVSFIAINSNDAASYPEDSFEKMKESAGKNFYTFPYLFDESQEVAKAYQAACTPDFYIFDKNLKLVYRGQFDDSRPGNEVKVTGKDLTTALDSLIAGQQVSTDQKPSIGCNIKWKK
ncbi:MAG: thioredoxin family protein [Candidatus Caenarcaniphilales bacterium]|nr:thioredoxin family protein [Candidatus Caenarcaniphilales bacterium]